mgnify:FL=1
MGTNSTYVIDSIVGSLTSVQMTDQAVNSVLKSNNFDRGLTNHLANDYNTTI